MNIELSIVIVEYHSVDEICCCVDRNIQQVVVAV